jgi:hypothetical protein
MTSQAIPPISKLHIGIRQISPMIWRRILVRSESPLARIHDVTPIAFGWSDAHLHRFRIHGRDSGISRPGGPWFFRDAGQVRLADFPFRSNERFLYEYDSGDSWRHQVRIEDGLSDEPKRSEAIRSASVDNAGRRRKTAAAPGPSCDHATRCRSA